ncbi:MAG TPA: ATP-binding protein [Nocardioidaceae bacterium]|nr:ATP-binding protein [Nocardioidaceae bacterium]
MSSARTLSLLAAAAGALITAMVIAGVVDVGYSNLSAHLVLDTFDTCVALLVSYLLYGRFLRSSRLQDQLLLQGWLLLAVASSSTSMTRVAGLAGNSGRLDVWLPLAIRVAAALSITAAAIIGTRPRLARANLTQALVPTLGILAVLVVTFSALVSYLPPALDPNLSPDPFYRAALESHPALLGTQIVTALCFLLAAALFAGQADRRDDQLVRWLGPACVFAAFARINYLLFPSLYSEWLYTGDVMRTACYVLLLVGATREIGAYWPAQARAAVMEDRNRLARELHDGVVQELGYIRSESRSLLSLDQPRTERILDACDRALDEARQAVEVMGSTNLEEPLGFTLHRAARQVSERYGVELELALDTSVTANQQQRHALLRIVREAVANAARHGRAQRVRMELQRTRQATRRLAIFDDGQGFDVTKAMEQRTGFGLTSMRERAEGLPGAFEVDSSSDKGTIIAVTW